MFVKSLIEENAKETLNTFKKKIKNKEKFTEKDKYKFSSIPLMDLKNKELYLKETIYLTLKIDYLSDEDIRKFWHILLNYAKEWLGDDVMLEIEREIAKNDVHPDVLAMLERVAIMKIEDKLLVHVAYNMLNKGFSFEDISDITGLSLNQIYSLSNSK